MTGASGFVGRHLLPLLENAGHDVFHLARKMRGQQREMNWDFKGSLPDNLPVCDVVVHLAAYVDFSQTMKVDQYEINTTSTARLAKYCQETGASFILASMIGVHGNTMNINPASTISPATHYGMSKYLAEQIVRCFLSDAVVIRIAGIYGINGPGHLGLNTAITNAVYNNCPPVLRGPGQSRRNYICVKDVAKWIFRLVERRNAGESLADCDTMEAMYLAGPECMTIEEYLQAIVDVLLPGQEILREEGSDWSDCIVSGTPSLFPLTSFHEYLTELSQIKVDGENDER